MPKVKKEVLKEPKEEPKKVKSDKEEAFEKFWANLIVQNPDKAKAFEESGEVVQIKADFIAGLN